MNVSTHSDPTDDEQTPADGSPALRLSAFQVRAIAVEAMVDPRTVVRLLGGISVRPMNAMRIKAALRRMMTERTSGGPTGGAGR